MTALPDRLRPDDFSLRLLSQPAVIGPGGMPGAAPRAWLLERRDAVLLAWLAWLGSASRAELARAIWPHAEPAQAMASLRQRLFRLRRALGADLVLGTGELRLHPAVRHDLGDDMPATGDAGLLAGLDFHDLPGLDELVDEWRSRWRTAAGARRAERAEALEAQGRLAEALAWAQSVVHANPLSEHAHRRLMRLHYQRGDRAAALAAFERCAQLLRGGLDVAPGPETAALAGLIQRSETALTLVPAPGVTAVLQATLRRPPRLVGRDAAWREGAEALQAGRVLLVTGEAGVGKTRFAEDLARSRGGLRLLKAHAADLHAPHALLSRWLTSQPLVLDQAWVREELARLLPALGPAPERPAEALRLAQALSQALPRPTGTLLLDDLQWCDGASLQLLLAWLSRVGADPTASTGLVLTLRSGEPVPDAVEALGAGLARLALTPLSHGEVEAFVESLELPADDGAAARRTMAQLLWQRTGGRPLFMLELLRDDGARLARLGQAGAAGPALQGLIDARLARLPAPALRLMQVAALMAGEFSLEAAAAVMAAHPLDLAEPVRLLEEAQWLSGGGIAFDLAAEAALRSLPEPVARLLHPLIARELAARQAPPARVAHHWQQAGRWAEAAAAYEQAAERARAASQRGQELALLDAACACHHRAEDAAGLFRAGLLAAVASAYGAAPGELDQRLDALRPLAADDAGRLALAVNEAKLRMVKREDRLAHAAAERAVQLATLLGDVDARLAALGWQGLALVVLEQMEAGLAVLEAGHSALHDGLAAWARRDFLGAVGYAQALCGSHQAALDPLARAAELAEAMGDLGDAQDHLTNLAVNLQYLCRSAEALACFERVRDCWLRMGRPESLTAAPGLLQAATALGNAGRFDEALELTEWALRQFERGQAEVWVAYTRHRLARLYLRLGQLTRAQQTLTPLTASADTGLRLARARLLSRIDAAHERPAAPALHAVRDEVHPELNPADRLMFELAWAALLPADEGLVALDRLLAEAGSGFPQARARAQIERADALRRLGRGDEAAAAAREAVALADAAEPLDMELPAFWWLAHLALSAGRDTAQAAEALQRGWAWLDIALPHVPAAFKPGFESRNEAVRQLLTARKRMPV